MKPLSSPDAFDNLAASRAVATFALERAVQVSWYEYTGHAAHNHGKGLRPVIDSDVS
jgi:hypothetical protein